MISDSSHETPRPKVLVFESHPVQYRAPVYRALHEMLPEQFKVVYGTDQSVRGWADSGFGQGVAWDEPLLEGYPVLVIGNQAPGGLTGFSSLSGKGVDSVIRDWRPSRVLLTQFRYAFDWAAFLSAKWHGIPVWIRQETQDEAFRRSYCKSLLRSVFYHLLYSQVSHAFYIGLQNQRHLLKHGIPASSMSRAPYATLNRFLGVSEAELISRRLATREKLGFGPDDWVVSYSGKFIEKKDPMLLLNAIEGLPQLAGRTVSVVMIGSGELEPALRCRAARLHLRGGKAVFAGFVNQSAIGDYYLAADALVLPSQRMGETWGLVVNEALQAGCAVVVTDAVGCASEFGEWERVRVIPAGSVAGCRDALAELSMFPRNFSWCREQLEDYSIQAAARALAEKLRLVP